MAVITPEYLARSGTEHGEQVALFCWANKALWQGFAVANDMGSYGVPPATPIATPALPALRWLYAIPNGGGRGMVQGTALKAEGVKSGVSDVCLPVPAHCYHGLYIEMKRVGGKPSDVKPEQREFIDFVKGNGYAAEVAFGWKQAAQIIQWYLGR
jgi:hypothetical protein